MLQTTFVDMKFLLDKIRLKRLQLGYSQEYMGEMLGSSQQMYHRLETGKQDFKVSELLVIATILKLKVLDLFQNDEIVIPSLKTIQEPKTPYGQSQSIHIEMKLDSPDKFKKLANFLTDFEEKNGVK